MKIVDFSERRADPITRFGSVAASSVALADGSGEGRGWVQGGDGTRVELAAGQGAWLARGEHHAKGSDQGMTAIMVQVRDLEPRAR